jgi:hypothetical protein
MSPSVARKLQPPAKRGERPRRDYTYAGAIVEVGLASIRGEFDLTAVQVIDELVELFHRIAGD